jgi:hypothetical protein
MQAILWWLAYENCFGKGTVYESNNPFAWWAHKPSW